MAAVEVTFGPQDGKRLTCRDGEERTERLAKSGALPSVGKGRCRRFLLADLEA